MAEIYWKSKLLAAEPNYRIRPVFSAEVHELYFQNYDSNCAQLLLSIPTLTSISRWMYS